MTDYAHSSAIICTDYNQRGLNSDYTNEIFGLHGLYRIHGFAGIAGTAMETYTERGWRIGYDLSRADPDAVTSMNALARVINNTLQAGTDTEDANIILNTAFSAAYELMEIDEKTEPYSTTLKKAA